VLCLNGHRFRSWIVSVNHCFFMRPKLRLSFRAPFKYYGHLVLRLMGCFVLFYTSRVICKGQLTMEEIIFSLKHYWRFVDSEALELKALSQGVNEKAA
jgi:hypothetical protein